MSAPDNLPPRPLYPPPPLPAGGAWTPPAPPEGADHIAPPPPAPGSVPRPSMPPRPPRGRGRRHWWWIAAAAVVVVALVVGGIVWATRPAPSVNALPGSEPELRYTFEDDDHLYWPDETRLTGTADDLYIAAPGDRGTDVTRYVDGKSEWTTQIGDFDPESLTLVGDILIVHTLDYDASEIFGLDADTGKTVWSLPTEAESGPRVVDNRYYLVTASGEWDGAGTVIEFDPATGEELRTFSGDTLTEVDAGYASSDVTGRKTQLVDFDLKPVGKPLTIQTGIDPVIARDDQGWIYFDIYLRSTGDSAFVGLSPTGTREFECEMDTLEAAQARWESVHRIDEHTFVAVGYRGARAFTVDGAECSTLWDVPGTDETRFTTDGEHLIMHTLANGKSGGNPRGSRAKHELLDWRTGETLTSGTAEFILDDNGRVLTREDDAVIVRDIASGETLWAIDVQDDSHVFHAGTVVAIVTAEPRRNTIEVYSR